VSVKRSLKTVSERLSSTVLRSHFHT